MSDVLLTLYLTRNDDHLRGQIRGTMASAPPDLPTQRLILPTVEEALTVAAAFAESRHTQHLPYGGCEVALAPVCVACGHTLQLDETNYCALCLIDISQDSER
jgi:hypothetical protein